MHVLYFIDSLMRAGAEQSLASLAPHLVARGVRLDVAYLFERPGLKDDLVAAGGSLFPLTGTTRRTTWIRWAYGLVRSRRPDLIHTTLFEADIVGRMAGALAGTPVVSSLVNLNYGPEQLANPTLVPWRLRAAQVVDAITARKVSGFHAVTSQVANVMARRLRIPRSRIEVIPRGRNPEQLGMRTPQRRARARTQLRIGIDAPLLLGVARHEHQKGLDVLLEALPYVRRELPTMTLALAGSEGDTTGKLRDTVQRLHLNGAVRFLGSRRDVPELLCAADVFVFPSRWEGMPGAVLESMALETPIVASDLPSIREMVGDDGAAVLVTPGESEALAAGIVRSFRRPDEAAQRARIARVRFLERFTMNRVAERMFSFYHKTLRG
jgi:glycosyltransferase involved in cell wall biosynthesis